MDRRPQQPPSRGRPNMNRQSQANSARSQAQQSQSQAHLAESQANLTHSLLEYDSTSSTSGEPATSESSFRSTSFPGQYSAPGSNPFPPRAAHFPSSGFNPHPRPGLGSGASSSNHGSPAWSSRSGGSDRAFAPGLGVKKPKVDPYDPTAMLAAKDDYTFLKHKQSAEVRGTWTTIDPDSERRKFDQRWYEQRRQAASGSGSNASGTQTPIAGPSGLASNTASSIRDVQHPSDRPQSSGTSEMSMEPMHVDERFEDPNLDIDPEVRAEFRPVGEVLRERVVPRSIVEERNARIAPQRAAAPKMKVVFGQGVSKTMERLGDLRGEHQDRYGNYIGEDLGKMKKYLQDQRQELIHLRDEEMIRRTKEKRAWDALSPEEKERQLAKKQAPVRAFALALGEQGFDSFEFDEIPDIYTKRVTAEHIAAWEAQMNRDSVRNVTTEPRFFEGDSLRNVTSEPLFVEDDSLRSGSTTPRPVGRRVTTDRSRHQGARRTISTAETSSGTVRVTGKTTLPTPAGSTPLVASRLSRTTTTSTRSSSLIRFGEPTLAPLGDIRDLPPPRDNKTAAIRYDRAKEACSTRGRVVLVALHEMVTFTPTSVSSRLFGGVIQEIQLHPRERMAIVVFLFPNEAESFVRHSTTIQERDPQAYRRMQLDAEWYGGEERKAVMPLQRGVMQAVIGEDVSRVLKLERIPVTKKREQLGEELKARLGTILVNVSLVKDPKRHVQHNQGHSCIIEFASIKDAYDSLRRFRAGKIKGYEDKPVSWLHDPCDQPAPKSKHCRCINCMEE
ncbi:MAG: hypothetical protein M1823_005837 [Watsoniomyces obsoletus]|nr:MAG: hypothetical protein M1823_005837 [Watsoniomyces obsoletus]